MFSFVKYNDNSAGEPRLSKRVLRVKWPTLLEIVTKIKNNIFNQATKHLIFDSIDDLII